MIVRMQRVRIMGPKHQLEKTLSTLQQIGVIHLSAPQPNESLSPFSPSPAWARHRDDIAAAVVDIETCLNLLGVAPSGRRSQRDAGLQAQRLLDWVRLAHRLRRQLEALEEREAHNREALAVIVRFEDFARSFKPLASRALRWPNGRPFYLVLDASRPEYVKELRKGLTDLIGNEFELFSQPLGSHEVGVLLMTTAESGEKVSALLDESRIQEMQAPEAYEGKSLHEMAEALRERRQELQGVQSELRRERDTLKRTHSAELLLAQSVLHDQLRLEKAHETVAETPRAFVVEGWVPQRLLDTLQEHLAAKMNEDVVLELMSVASWKGEDVPVVLSNPRLFRPFELITRRMPLPRYGTIDPTPFVGVFFPLFFGLILGDVGYGVVLAAGAALLRWRATKVSWQAVAEIAGACAAFTIIFGFLYGEFFGSFGMEMFGMHALALHREESVIPFLLVALALGVVHVTLGIIIGAVGAWRSGDKRLSLGRSVSGAMVALVILALLAAIEVLPKRLFTPMVVTVLIAFPVLIVAEGFSAVIELMSTFGHILSYARIMAVGTASVMMAVVANRMVGVVGSFFVGVVLALLFHLVNFAIGLFSPSLHALRLHYVEFFGKFYSPGGTEYSPLSHWKYQENGNAT